MTVLDLTPYIIDPYGLRYAWEQRKLLRLQSFARPYIKAGWQTRRAKG